MESLQLFTGLLLAVCVTHLIFSAKAIVSGWMEKHQSNHAVMAGGKAAPDWYVFFDPADLVGKQKKTNSRQKPTGKVTVSRRPRSSSPRPRAQL